MNHTWAPATEATYKLKIWSKPPDDEEATNRGEGFGCILIEWQAQVANIKKAATAEAEEAEKGDDEIDKDGNKQAKLNSKWSTHCSKRKQGTSSKKVKPLNYNLDEYFGVSQSQKSQKMMLHPSTLWRTQRKPSWKMILMVPVTEEWTSHLKG